MHDQSIILPFDDDRFWAKVDFNGPMIEDSPERGPCWLWTGSHHPLGYGTMTRGRTSTSTHRYAFLMTYETIPNGKVVCHHCDNPPCVNPAHLFAGTMSENTQDMIRKERNKAMPRPPIETMPRGEKVWRAKLTADKVRDIRARYAAGGVTMQELADEHRMTSAGVSEVIHRHTWKHVA